MIISTTNLNVVGQSTTGLNAEISSLRSRVNRLESEIRRLGRSSNLPTSPREPNPPRTGSPAEINGNLVGSSDPLFERFATLLIELKEDVRDLNRRLTEVETQIN
ncbi:hypothetical protein Xen7305DRAFT_00040090 [Xenococcus sp. PCC 7305]|nr:hypothetical protein Xen7305DRAFT_00040090 [Xenococcus sp. PCC 7305]